MIYFYAALAFAVGVASEWLRARWILLASLAVVCFGILVDSWRYIDWQRGGIFETLATGFFWNVVPLILLFVVPFVVGKYSLRGIQKVLGGW